MDLNSLKTPRDIPDDNDLENVWSNEIEDLLSEWPRLLYVTNTYMLSLKENIKGNIIIIRYLLSS